MASTNMSQLIAKRKYNAVSGTFEPITVNCTDAAPAGLASVGAKTLICDGKLNVQYVSKPKYNSIQKSSKSRKPISYHWNMQPAAKEEVRNFKYVVKFSDTIDKELHILSKLQGHPNIVNIVPGVKVTGSGIPKNPYYVMEYCTEGNCYTIIADDKYKEIRTDKNAFSRFIRNFISDTYSAIKYIHSKEVIHCDIKPDNIFINKPENPNPKLAYVDTLVFKIGDLGEAIEYYGEIKRFTEYYCPPRKYAKKCKYFIDYYGFAIALSMLITGSLNAPNRSNETIKTDEHYIRDVLCNFDLWLTNDDNKDKLTPEVMNIVKEFYTELAKVETHVIDAIDNNDAGQLYKHISLDAKVYKDLFTKMSGLNNYKFTHNSNITQSDINAVTKNNLNKYSLDMQRKNRTIKRPGIGSWFRRLVGKPRKVESKSKRVKQMAFAQAALRKHGANTYAPGKSNRKSTGQTSKKLTRMERFKKTFKNLFKRS